MRGEREELAQLERLGTVLAGKQQPFAITGIAILRRDGEAGELRALVLAEGIERGAAADDAVVLDHQEIADLRLQELAAALDERAVGLERLDQRQHAADILDARRAELLERIGGGQGAGPPLRGKLEEPPTPRAA